MTDRHAATHDPGLSARMRVRRPMRHEEGTSHDEDRPPRVPAASGVCYLKEHLVVVGDDANWLAPIDTDDRVHALPPPATSDGWRVLGARCGTKQQRSHLEADGETLPSEIFDAEFGAGFHAA